MNKAIFLDRDDVINEVLSKRVKYVNKPEELFLLPNVGKAIAKLNQLPYKIFVVTNQGGIGLGYMSEEALNEIHEKMKSDLEKEGANIEDIAYCPHKPKSGCPCRKPEPGMILHLAKQYDINLGSSYMVGDRAVDIEAGERAGTKTVLVGTRKEKTNADYIFKDLLEFAEWLEKQEGK